MTLMPDSSNNPSALNADISSAGRLLSDPPGEVLKRARQARKLDLETAADQLNLSAQVVRALEEDAYEKLPSPTFIRGYIRCYARLLKLSGDDLVRSYERIVTAQQTESQEVADVLGGKPQKIKKGWLVLGLLAIVVLAIGFVVTSVDETKHVEPRVSSDADVRPEPVAIVVEDTVDEVAEPEIEPKVVTRIDEPVAVVAETVAEAVVDTVADTVTEITVEPVTTTSSVEVVSENIVSENIAEIEASLPVNVPQQDEIEKTPVNLELSTLTMTFSGECWVEVWDATGKRIYANLRKAGQKVSLQGAAPIEVKLGDGSKVKLAFNGNPVLFASSKRTSVAHVTLGE